MLAGVLATLVLVLAPRSAVAQRVGGAMDVSLTVLPSVATRAVKVTAFHIGRDGTASLRTTAPMAAQASQVVMSRISSSANGFMPVSRAPALLRGGRAAGAVERELSYQVDVGRAGSGGAPRDIQLRIELLTVAGT